ncbi:MAG: hypothetical protein P4L75_02095, partial [Clostridia bacterium]|nr:hypothetical protein [Clostridia bacterium]
MNVTVSGIFDSTDAAELVMIRLNRKFRGLRINELAKSPAARGPERGEDGTYAPAAAPGLLNGVPTAAFYFPAGIYAPGVVRDESGATEDFEPALRREVLLSVEAPDDKTAHNVSVFV